jgi:hypothetical protein
MESRAVRDRDRDQSKGASASRKRGRGSLEGAEEHEGPSPGAGVGPRGVPGSGIGGRVFEDVDAELKKIRDLGVKSGSVPRDQAVAVDFLLEWLQDTVKVCRLELEAYVSSVTGEAPDNLDRVWCRRMSAISAEQIWGTYMDVEMFKRGNLPIPAERREASCPIAMRHRWSGVSRHLDAFVDDNGLLVWADSKWSWSHAGFWLMLSPPFNTYHPDPPPEGGNTFYFCACSFKTRVLKKGLG